MDELDQIFEDLDYMESEEYRNQEKEAIEQLYIYINKE